MTHQPDITRIDPAKLRFLSLGAGVQSSTIALMACDFPLHERPDCAVFADTNDEGAATYKHLEWLIKQLNYPVCIVSRGSLSEALFSGEDEARIPAYVEAGGLSKRQCTRNWKVRVIRKEVRRLLGRPGRAYVAPGSVEQWIGISLNEAARMKPAGVRFINNRFLLIERAMTRVDCINWLTARGYPIPPKSACVYCGFKSDIDWQEMKDNCPDDFEKACVTDERLRTPENIIRFHGALFLHKSLFPLRIVDFKPKPRLTKWFQPDMWMNECYGGCGL